MLIRRPTFKTFVLIILFSAICIARNVEKVHCWINRISRFLLCFKFVKKLKILIIWRVNIFKLHIDLFWLYLALLLNYELNRLIPNITWRRLKLLCLLVILDQWIWPFRDFRCIAFVMIFASILFFWILNQMNWWIVRLIFRRATWFIFWFLWFRKLLRFSYFLFTNKILFWKWNRRDKWT